MTRSYPQIERLKIQDHETAMHHRSPTHTFVTARDFTPLHYNNHLTVPIKGSPTLHIDNIVHQILIAQKEKPHWTFCKAKHQKWLTSMISHLFLVICASGFFWICVFVVVVAKITTGFFFLGLADMRIFLHRWIPLPAPLLFLMALQGLALSSNFFLLFFFFFWFCFSSVHCVCYVLFELLTLYFEGCTYLIPAHLHSGCGSLGIIRLFISSAFGTLDRTLIL